MDPRVLRWHRRVNVCWGGFTGSVPGAMPKMLWSRSSSSVVQRHVRAALAVAEVVAVSRGVMGYLDLFVQVPCTLPVRGPHNAATAA